MGNIIFLIIVSLIGGFYTSYGVNYSQHSKQALFLFGFLACFIPYGICLLLYYIDQTKKNKEVNNTRQERA
jgi:hypothetical protein